LTQLSDPQRSRVVLIGSSTYDNFPELPSVANNLTALRDVLADPDRWGLPPSACTIVHNPESAAQVHDAVQRAARHVDVAGLLMVYSAGHGVIDADTGELHLAIGHTDPDSAYASAVPYEWIRRAVGQSRSNHRVVILDCCYAGRAIGGLSATGSGLLADRAEIDRSCVMVAASANRIALAPPEEPYTAFTGALIKVLREGVPGGADPLELNTIYEEVVRIQRAGGRPVPELRARNGGERIPIVSNAWVGAPHVLPGQRPTPAPSSYAGRIFVGQSDTADPEIVDATLCVLVHTAADGAIGIRLDQPSDRSPAELIGERAAQALNAPVVFDGGPVRDVLIVLASVAKGVAAPPGWRHVIGDLYVVPSGVDLAEVWQVVDAVFLFAGYAGWRPQGLEAEIRRGQLVERAGDLTDWVNEEAAHAH
jgi:putative AlgH/UPF0301 family transcriptional regulator